MTKVALVQKWLQITKVVDYSSSTQEKTIKTIAPIAGH